ncbi:MAG: glycosyl hydrolase, partial [Gemmatimonadaceae bacterium]|nr:glycosyl hydrolase [Gemmatimonadaceae bacterium]
NITPSDLPPFSRISVIDAGAHAPGTAYLAAKRYQLDDRAPYLYRTHDFGKTWRRIVQGIRADAYTHVVREDPTRAGLLFAGTEHGVYVSFNDGAQWQSLDRNLPDVQVPDLVVEGRDLVIATHGRSMWIMDGIDALRQLTPAIAQQPVHLFTPAPAIRGVQTGGFGASGLYDATFDYRLAAPADSLTLEVLDATGALVRRYRAVRRDPKAPAPSAPTIPGTPTDCEERSRPDQVPGLNAGMNRFRWDLRYPGATTFPCMILWSASSTAGPQAPPGRYQVRLTVNGTTQVAAFEVKRDPRLKGVTDADLRARFVMASRIRDEETKANDAVIRIRTLRAAAAEQVAKARRTETKALGDSVSQRFTAIEEALYQTRNRSGQDPLNFPIKLNNRIAALRRSVETGEARPTAGSSKVLAELAAELAKELAALDQLVKVDLARLNVALKAESLGPIM